MRPSGRFALRERRLTSGVICEILAVLDSLREVRMTDTLRVSFDASISPATMQFIIDSVECADIIENLSSETRSILSPYLPTRITAIKRVRSETGLGLKEAYSAVLAIESAHKFLRG